MPKINYKAIALVLGLLVVSFFFVWYIFAFTEPTSPPPGGNVPAPLNVSINAQAKEGALVVATNSAVTTGLIVQYGNVGIGTTSPDRKLDVVGQILAKTDDVLTDWIEFWPHDSAIIAKSDNPIRIGHASTPDAAVWVERMRIDTAGNVGIGTSTPTKPEAWGAGALDVYGPIRGGSYYDDDINYYANLNTGGRLGGTWKFDGNVAIGGVGPVARLHVRDDPGYNLLVRTWGSAISLDSVNDTNSAFMPMNFNASTFTFQGGKVGINMDTPGFARLQVGGAVEVTTNQPTTDPNTGGPAYYLRNTNSAYLWQWWPDNSGKLFWASGIAGVMTNRMSLATDGSLEVFGALGYRAGGSYTVWMTNVYPTYLEYWINGSLWGVNKWASSERFKENITDLELDSSIIYDLNPVSFNWKPERGGQRDFGILAEEAAEISPLLVVYDKEGKPFSVKYDLLSVLLLNELKKKATEINALNETMEQLETRIEKLEQRR